VAALDIGEAKLRLATEIGADLAVNFSSAAPMPKRPAEGALPIILHDKGRPR
jgi:D-arabinose 1-dehydrogenase-like Zn-dependent alcohol dehydrogenase